jgi:hypothetical protein
MNQAEKNDILDQHKKVYDGFVTTYGQQINQQPLYVQDFANDKEGVTVSNKGVVKPYTNMRINEMRHDGMSTGLFSDEEDKYEFITPKKEFTGLDQIGDGENDLEYGTMDDEDLDDVEYYIEFDTDEVNDDEIFDEIDEELIEPLQEQLNKSLDMFKRFSKY